MNHKIILLGFVFCTIASTMFSSASATLQIPTIPIPTIPLPTILVNLSVESSDMDGNTFPGQWVELWHNGVIIEEGFTPFFTQVKSRAEYQVFIYDDPDEAKFFDHWENGNTDRMRPITPLLGTYLTAFFQDSTPTENSPPGGGDDFAETPQGVPVIIDVLANDSDPDGDALSVDSIVIPPQNGQAVINFDSTITYIPDPGFVGQDSFDYQISDGNGGTDTALVAIDVLESAVGNNPPEAGDDFAETPIDTPVTIDVLGNDIDPDEDTLFVDSIVIAPENGDAAINEDGTVTYMPFEGFVGDDTFDYQVSDGNGGTDTALVTITVSG